MILQNFKVSEDKKEIIGISGKRMLEWLRDFASNASPFKMYCIKIVEVNHSQLSRNYMYMLLGVYADELGYKPEQVEKMMLRSLDDLICSDLDDRYSKAKFYDQEVANPSTGEVIPGKLKSVSKFTTSQMSLFIDLIIVLIKSHLPDFVIPDPSQYIFEREGRKNELLFPEEKISLK